MARLRGLCVALLVSAHALAVSASFAWPQYGHDGHHSGNSNAQGKTSTPSIVWSRPLGQQFVSPATIGANETLYVGTGRGAVMGLYGGSGDVAWSTALANGVGIPVVARSGAVLVSTQAGYLHALDGSTGNSLWSTCFGRNPAGSPVIDANNVVYVATQLDSSDDVQLCTSGLSGTVFSLDVGNGSVRWDALHVDSFATPAVHSPASLLALGSLNALIAVNSNTGNMMWNYSVGVVSSPALDSNGAVYVLAVDGYLYSFSSAGHLQWRVTALGGPNPNPFYAMPAVPSNGVVYAQFLAAQGTGMLLCAISGKAGTVLWCAPVPSAEIGSYVPEYYPVVDANGSVYVLGQGVTCFAADGTPLWHLLAPSNPFFTSMGANGTLYVVMDHGNVAAIL